LTTTSARMDVRLTTGCADPREEGIQVPRDGRRLRVISRS
jgi:hypothetical protein